MKQFITLLAIMLSVSAFAFTDPDPDSDRNGSITGIVIDKILQEPIPYVSIVLKDLDGEIITGGITDDNGMFNVEEIPTGKINLYIQYI